MEEALRDVSQSLSAPSALSAPGVVDGGSSIDNEQLLGNSTGNVDTASLLDCIDPQCCPCRLCQWNCHHSINVNWPTSSERPVDVAEELSCAMEVAQNVESHAQCSFA